MTNPSLAYDFDQKFIFISERLYDVYKTSPSLHYNVSAKTFVISMKIGEREYPVISHNECKCKHKALNSFIEDLQSYIQDFCSKEAKEQKAAENTVQGMLNKIARIKEIRDEALSLVETLNSCMIG